jgi:hypothetical protein
MHLLPRQVDVRGPGSRRVRLAFAEHEDLAASMEAWIEAQCAEAPSAVEHPRSLIAWWPGFKRRLADVAQRLNRVAQRRRQRPGTRAREALASVKRAQLAVDSAPTAAQPR